MGGIFGVSRYIITRVNASSAGDIMTRPAHYVSQCVYLALGPAEGANMLSSFPRTRPRLLLGTG